MKPTELREKFIQLRAEGKSYRTIAEELCIAKTTAQEWGKQYEDDINRIKRERLEGIYEQYHMGKEARIKALADSLTKINTALDHADLEAVEPDKLLRLKLQYAEALKKEYTPAAATGQINGVEPTDIIAAYKGLYNRVLAGEVTDDQANRESNILANMLKAYEMNTLKEKIDMLQATVGR